LEVIDIVFYYKTHSKQMLLAVSSLEKQKLILGYTWLKDHNPKVNWKKEEVHMTWYLPQCKGYCTLWRKQTLKKRQEVQALQHCQTGPSPLLDEEKKKLKALYRTNG